MLSCLSCSFALCGGRTGCASKQAYVWASERVSIRSNAARHGVPHPVQCGLAKPEQHHQMLALAGRVRTKASAGPSEEVSQPQEEAREPQLANGKRSFRFGSSSG